MKFKRRIMVFSSNIYIICCRVFFITYITFVILASISEGIFRMKKKETYDKIFNTKAGKVLAAFSFRKNWYRLTAPNNNPDFQKLRSIQGIRFYNMICVIFCHTVMATFAGPVENPKYIENVTNDVLNMFVANGQYVVQTFFVISGWLLSFHFFQMLEDKKNISTKHVILTLINRYVRSYFYRMRFAGCLTSRNDILEFNKQMSETEGPYPKREAFFDENKAI